MRNIAKLTNAELHNFCNTASWRQNTAEGNHQLHMERSWFPRALYERQAAVHG